jgi:tRNA(adenine34) deaminase
MSLLDNNLEVRSKIMIKDFHRFDHDFFMQEALREAEEAGKRGDRPIGAVIVHNGAIL